MTTIAQVLSNKELVDNAKAWMIDRWNYVVESGGLDLGEMIGSLVNQVYGGCQGWDCSYSELDAFVNAGYATPESQIMMTDEQMDQWRKVVQDAAYEWLTLTSPLHAWGAYMINCGYDCSDLTKGSIKEFAIDNTRALYGDGGTDDDITQEMADWALLNDRKAHGLEQALKAVRCNQVIEHIVVADTNGDNVNVTWNPYMNDGEWEIIDNNGMMLFATGDILDAIRFLI